MPHGGYSVNITRERWYCRLKLGIKQYLCIKDKWFCSKMGYDSC
jgi:hypothetical protein